jgi:hypothetical protein
MIRVMTAFLDYFEAYKGCRTGMSEVKEEYKAERSRPSGTEAFFFHSYHRTYRVGMLWNVRSERRV